MQTVFSNFFRDRRSVAITGHTVLAGLAVAAMLSAGTLAAQTTTAQTQATATQDSAAQAAAAQAPTATLSNQPAKKKSKNIRESKDTRKADKVEEKVGGQVNKDLRAARSSQLPDKQLYDKALAQEKSGHFDVARLDLQTLLNTYPESEYLMKAKLAVADCWYHEGGSAALAQAEQEYTDFITFFPNAPEAAEAQMRVGDIYFKQMDVPDRDFTKGVKAEDAYRTMLKQYPEAPPVLLKEGQQKLREVQELMAVRELELGQFYASHENWPASIARYQTIVNTYPQFSHMDDALIGVGDGYAAEAKIVRAQNMPEGPKAALLQEYDGKAAAAYRKVVLEHAAAPHVEDAKERLEEMNLPVPTPTPAQEAASEALEGSRAQYTMAKRFEVFFLRRPDVVVAATSGTPPLDDPAVTTAPGILHGIEYDYCRAFPHPDPKQCDTFLVAKAPNAEPDDTVSPNTPAPATPAASAPLAFQEVPTAGAANSGTTADTMQEAPATSSATGSGVGVEIVQPSSTTTPASNLPSATGAQDPNYGLKTGAPVSTALPPAEAAAAAPDQVNEVSGQAQPAVAPGTKATYDKQDESSSKHQPKKGVDKLNPF
jgi:outer membrane protein assembly factor BamD